MYPKDFFTKAPTVKGGYCFVVMPFTSELSKVYSAIKAGLETVNLEITCHRADEVIGSGDVMTDVLRNLAEAEIVIVDLTTRNPECLLRAWNCTYCEMRRINLAYHTDQRGCSV
jgi:hypothetical protein